MLPCGHSFTASPTKCQSGPFTHFRQFMPVPSGKEARLKRRHWANLSFCGSAEAWPAWQKRLCDCKAKCCPTKAPIPKSWPQLILSRFHRSCGTLVVGNGVAVEQPQAQDLTDDLKVAIKKSRKISDQNSNLSRCKTHDHRAPPQH